MLRGYSQCPSRPLVRGSGAVPRPGRAEPWTHLLGSGAPRKSSGTAGAMRSRLRTASVCGLETSATAKQGRWVMRPPGGRGLRHGGGQAESRPGGAVPSLTTPLLLAAARGRWRRAG